MISFQNDHLSILFQLLEEAESANPTSYCWQDKTISYEQFKRIGQDARLLQHGLLVRIMFNPQTFFKLPKDETGAIFTSMLFDYALEYRAQRLLRIDLAEIDVERTGNLTRDQIQEFVQRICTASNNHVLAEYDFFTRVAARKLWFLLHQASSRVSIPALQFAPLLQELKDAVREEDAVENWFSPAHMRDLNAVFCQLDLDANGTLSKTEFQKIRLGGINYHPSVTDLLVDRMFEMKLGRRAAGGKQPREMDFDAFLDFVLASQNKQNGNALRYFWDLLDVESAGWLSQTTITAWLHEVKRTAINTGYAYEEKGVTVESVCNEVFDLFPERAREERITWHEFKRNKPSASIIITLLTDPNGFVDYDTRETRLQQQRQQEGEEDAAAVRDELNNVI